MSLRGFAVWNRFEDDLRKMESIEIDMGKER
jgi:hypothetical protein